MNILILGGDGYHKVHHENPRQLILGKYDLGGYLADRFWRTEKTKN